MPAQPPAVPTGVGRAQRVLATMAFTVIGVSALGVVALLVLGAAHVPQSAYRSGGLQILAVLPLVGLPLGLVLLLVTIVVTVVRRSQAAR